MHSNARLYCRALETPAFGTRGRRSLKGAHIPWPFPNPPAAFLGSLLLALRHGEYRGISAPIPSAQPLEGESTEMMSRSRNEAVRNQAQNANSGSERSAPPRCIPIAPLTPQKYGRGSPSKLGAPLGPTPSLVS